MRARVRVSVRADAYRHGAGVCLKAGRGALADGSGAAVEVGWSVRIGGTVLCQTSSVAHTSNLKPQSDSKIRLLLTQKMVVFDFVLVFRFRIKRQEMSFMNLWDFENS